MTIPSSLAAVRRSLATIAAADRPEVWISRFPDEELLARGAEIDRRCAAGQSLPLAGTVFAVKDNIDVAGLPTTAAFPPFAHEPDVNAPSVQLLLDAGAVVIGKTNLDQFATGLVGTRSPYGAVRNALDPTLVSGGSSSGSAVAVALGMVDFALGTDTAGSGRVPAGFNHIVGIKPTLGLVSSRGVVPACRSYDTVSVFARGLEVASLVMATICVPDEADPRSRGWAMDAPLGAPGEPTIGVPVAENLVALEASVADCFRATVDRLKSSGMRTVEVDIAALLAAARLLYDGALVAERAEAYGAIAEAFPGQLDPVVETIVTNAGSVRGADVIADQHALLTARITARELFSSIDALMVPTSPIHPSIRAVADDPVGLNSTIGTFTNFVNLLDLSAVAVPGSGDPRSTTDGVTLITPAFGDQVGLDIAARLTGQATRIVPSHGVDLVVFGAHMRGMPLSYQLEELGARFIREVTTAPGYSMTLLSGEVPRPAVEACEDAASTVAGELWRVPDAAVARVVDQLLAPPLGLGRVRLSDGSMPLACLGQHAEGPDISRFGGWRTWTAAQQGGSL